MLTFFAGLRRILALDYDRIVMGEVVLDVIRNRYLPDLEKKLASGGAADPDRLREVIDLWHEYSDSGASQEGVWNSIAANALKAISGGRTDDQMEEAASALTANFLTKQRWIDSFGSYDSMNGPAKMMAWWKAVVSNVVRDYWRDHDRETKGQTRAEPGEQDPIELVKAPSTDLDESNFRQLKRQMKTYVLSKIEDEVAKTLFRFWWDTAVNKSNNPEKVNMDRDVYEPLLAKLKDQGVKTSKSSLKTKWKQIRTVIQQFYRDIMGVEVRVGSERKLETADEVAVRVATKRLAEWILDAVRVRQWYLGVD